MIFGFIRLFRFQKKFSELFMLSLMARMEGPIFIKTEGLVDHVQFTVTVTEQIGDISIFWIRFSRLQQISNVRLLVMIGDIIFSIEVIHICCFSR